MASLELVFTGSDIDGAFLKNILEENQIGCLIKNSFNESMAAGWISGQPNVSKLYVDKTNFDKALEIIKEYLENNKTND